MFADSKSYSPVTGRDRRTWNHADLGGLPSDPDAQRCSGQRAAGRAAVFEGS
jgi:hypothetical protein